MRRAGSADRLSPVLFWHFFRHLILSRRAGSLVRRIAALSSAAIALSVFAFLVVLFVMNGMNASIRDRLIALEPHVVIHVEGANQAAQVVKRPELKALIDDPRLKTSPFETQEVILRTFDGQFRGAVARGLEENGVRDFLRELKRLQKTPAFEEDPGGPNEIPGDNEVLIGIDLARALNLFEGDPVIVLAPESLLLPVGETPRTERLRVRKIVATNLADLDAQLFVYTRGKALRGLIGSPARRAGLEVRLENGVDADAWKAAWGPHPGLKVETWSERNSALFFALKMERAMIGLFLGLAGIIAGSSILTVMALLLSQKRRDIALLRVTGLSKRDTVSLFTRVGLVLAGTAVFVGALLGIATGLYIEAYPLNVLPDIYYDSEIPAKFDLALTIGVLIVASLLSFFGAWIPARSVAGLEPSRVLRQKN